MAVKKLTEGATSGKKFHDDVVMFVDGNQIDVSGDFADAVYDACSEYSGLEGWIREYMNSLGDPIDPDGTMDLSELCYWFARELEMDFDDSDDFYVDGSGIVDNNDMSVEIFVEDGIDEQMVRKVTPNRIKKEARAVNGRPRALSPQYDSRKSFYNKAHVVDDNDGNSTLYSYNTPVCRIQDGKVELLPKWDYSATTLRHVKDFLQQNGFEAGSKAQIAKRYSVVAESKRRSSKRGVNEDYDDPSWEDIAENPYMGYEGLDDVKRALETAANDADDLRYYLENAWKAFDNDYTAAIEMFSGPDDAYAAAEALDKIKGLLAQAYKLIPDEVVNLANDSYGMYD